ncbi:MAG: flagellar biosynthetic protein FliO [Xanthobacteraceae bacterium]
MGFFEQIFGSELGLPARAVVALILVLALIALTVWLMRRFGETRGVAGASGRGRQQRLAVLDSAVVDARRRLVLIRRDNVEHLILIGGPTDVVVEPNIVRATPASGAVRPGARPGGYEAEDDASLIPHPEPGHEGERASPATPTPRHPAPGGAQEPPRTMPRPAQRMDPQYADMAQRLEAALRKPAAELDVPRASPAPPPPQRAPEPRTPEARPEPRVFEQRPATPPAPAPRVPTPRAPEPRAVEPTRAPEKQSAQPAQTQPDKQSAADVFGSLEDEMASLLRPGGKKESK